MGKLRQIFAQQWPKARHTLSQSYRAARHVIRWETYERLQLHAQALTYDTLLGLVPVIAVSFAVLDSFGGMAHVADRVENLIIGNVSGSPEVQQVVSGYLHHFVDNIQSGSLGAISIVLLIFSVMSLLAHVETAINTIFGPHRPRPLAIRLMSYWTLLTLGPVLLAASIAATAALHTEALDHLVLRMGWLSQLALSIVPIVSTWAAFTVLYVVVPHVRVRFSAALIAAIVAGTLWMGAKYGYAVYAKNALTLQNIYGSLATIPLFIMWLFVSWLLVLFGAQLAFALHHVHTEPRGQHHVQQRELHLDDSLH